MNALQIRDEPGRDRGSGRIEILNQQGNVDGRKDSVEVPEQVGLAEGERSSSPCLKTLSYWNVWP